MKSLHNVLSDALKDAGLHGSVQRDEVAVILSMISRGASLENAIMHNPETLTGAISTLSATGAIRGNTAPGMAAWIRFAKEARARGHK